MAVMLRSAAESAVCRILSFPINKRNNIYKRVRQAVRLGSPASFFAWNIALGDILTILMTQENVSRRSAWFSLSLMLFASERFCSAKSTNLLLFHHRVNRYLLGDGIGPDRAVDVRQSLFYNSGKVLRLGVDVCHLRQGFPLPETETLRRPVPSCRR